jgi:hypothetical protein
MTFHVKDRGIFLFTSICSVYGVVSTVEMNGMRKLSICTKSSRRTLADVFKAALNALVMSRCCTLSHVVLGRS